MNFDTIWSDIASTIVGGSVLTVLFFWFREKVFSLPEITGRWFFELHTENTAYNPYRNMKLQYVAMLWCEGHCVHGTVEKIYEDSSTVKKEYIGENRTRGRVEGYIEKNYFSKDKVFLHVVEDGHGRESTNFYELAVKSSDSMKGTFSSMVADQDGGVKWQREKF